MHGRGAAPFVPPATDIAANWDLSDAANVTFQSGSGDGDPISTIDDQSGNGHNWSRRAGSSALTWQSNVQNGLGVARFNGSDDAVEVSNWGIDDTTPGHLFVVLKVADDTVSNGFGRFGANIQDDHYPFTSFTVYSGFASTSRFNCGTVAGLDAWHLAEFWSASNDWAYYLNGGLVNAETTNTTGWASGFRFGLSQTVFLGCDLGQMLLYTAKKTGDDLTEIRDGLNSKWGLGF